MKRVVGRKAGMNQPLLAVGGLMMPLAVPLAINIAGTEGNV